MKPKQFETLAEFYERIKFVKYDTSNDFDTWEQYEDFLLRGVGGEWVYVFYSETSRLFKIGKTANLRRRFKEIQNNSGMKMTNVFALQLEPGIDLPAGGIENIIHTFFKNKRVKGEWFALNFRDLINIYVFFMGIGWDLRDFSYNNRCGTYAFRDYLRDINQLDGLGKTST